MKRVLLPLLIILPLAVSAQEFAYERDIHIPASAGGGEKTIWIPLDAHALQERNAAYQVVDEAGRPVPFKRFDGLNNLLQRAKVESAPEAADTIPQTSIAHLVDGDPSTYFQPVPAETQTFSFSFADPVAPDCLKFQLLSGRI